ncbi:glycoside hydrolase family 108 protein [Rhodoferax sp. WC2427]|uniref:glycoside hydrolase family 108 protein n=1 Tax=Rhodoferax sp. WC2427 TaxID=3234144 RepID=UPI00346731F7
MNFDQAFDRLMGAEGGYVNDPHDPGGETNWGISKRSYPTVDIKALTREGAKAIYLRDFWAPLVDAHPAVRFQTFDFAVNSGISTAVRKLQAAIGVADDGHWGPLSAAKLASMDVNDALMRFMAQRLRFWVKCSAWPSQGAGWVNRGARQLEYAAEDN